MTDPTQLAASGARPVAPDPALPRAEGSRDGGAAFKALLEKLEDKAREVRDAQTVERPEELAGAADRAKASITDALQLRDQLLEAYRASQQAGDGSH